MSKFSHKATLADLTGEDESRRLAAVQLLAELPLGYFEDHPPNRRAVGHFVPRLAELLRSHPSLPVRVECAQYIGEIGLPLPEAVEALRGGLQERDPRLLATCVWALGEFRQAAASAVADLLRHAHHPDREVRWRVAWAIDEIGVASPAALDTLATLFDDRDGLVRGYAVAAFGKTAQRSDVVAARLAKLAAGDPDPFVRSEASKVLATWGAG